MTNAARFAGLIVSSVSLCLLGTACKSVRNEGAAIHLLEQDRSSFYSYLRDFGVDKDPDQVFTLANGALRISGQHYGYLATKRNYQNYRLVAEFKWDEKIWPPRLNNACDSGVL